MWEHKSENGLKGKQVLGVTISDVHLCHKPPISRSAEVDWYGRQRDYLEQVGKLCEMYCAPLIIAGDIFDVHSPPVELVNFAIEHIPNYHGCYAVPGQHDLRYHSYEDMHKGAYWTLVQAKSIINLKPRNPVEANGLRLHGWPWGYKIEKCISKPHDFTIDIAVVHAYIWSEKKKTGYPGAPFEKTVGAYGKLLKGYDIALFGDNHKSTFYNINKKLEDKIAIFNPGSFMRRKSDEIDHKPCAGLICSDGSVHIQYLDTSKDKWVDFAGVEKAMGGIGAETFIEELNNLSDAAISFAETVNRLLEQYKTDPSVKELALKFLERGGAKK